MDRRVTSPTWGPPPPCKQALRSLSRGIPSSHLEKDERLILGHICIYSWKRHAFCYAVFGFARNRWINTLYRIVWETKHGRFTTLNIPKCEHFTLLVCPLRFLVISAMRRLGNLQSFKCYAFELFAMNATPARRIRPPWDVYMANCHPGWPGYPTWQTWQTGQPAKAGHPTYHVNVMKIK